MDHQKDQNLEKYTNMHLSTHTKPLITAIFYSLFLTSLAQADSDFYLGGIAVNEPNHDTWAQSLKAADMNTVAVTVYAKQGDWDSDNFWYSEEEPYVISEIRAAKKQGLKVTLILRVALDHAFEKNKFLWHGMIMPGNDETLQSWFSKYEKFALKWAKIAQEEQVDVFGVGSELRMLSQSLPRTELPGLIEFYINNDKQQVEYEKYMRYQSKIPADSLWVRGFQYSELSNYLKDKQAANRAWALQVGFLNSATDLNQTEALNASINKINQRSAKIKNFWGQLSTDIRSRFSGKLTYAANFDNYQFVGFWSDLDIIGINAYFPLRFIDSQPGRQISSNPKFANLEAELMASWDQIYNDIKSFKSREKISIETPIWFTELGYIYRENSTYAPWAGFGHAIIGSGETEQVILYNKEKVNLTERAIAIRALRKVNEKHDNLLQGILYWKLTTIKSHIDIEPFVMHLTPGASDPMQTELSLFTQ